MSEAYTWDRKTLDKGLIALFHYAAGLKKAARNPVSKVNRERIAGDADAVAYLAAFAEWNIEEMGIN